MDTVESVQRIEPARVEAPTEAIADVVAEVSAASATLGQALHPRTAASLAGVVRIMNRHRTHPRAGYRFASQQTPWTRYFLGSFLKLRDERPARTSEAEICNARVSAVRGNRVKLSVHSTSS